MARDFKFITKEDENVSLVASAKAREMELLSYDNERDAHEKAIEALGDIKWDETTQEYKNLSRDEAIRRAAKNDLESEATQKIIDLLTLDYHKREREAVIAETKKSERLYDHVLDLLPEGEELEQAVAALAEKEQIQR